MLTANPSKSRLLANLIIGLAVLFSIYTLYQHRTLWSHSAQHKPITPSLPLRMAKPVTVSYDIFGVYRASLDSDVPTSQLDIQVIGLFYATEPAQSSVILIVSGQPEKVYREGDVLDDNVRLHRIHRDGIVLKVAGKLESLPYQQDKLEFGPPPQGIDQE